MNPLLLALIIGIVEGLTEFLPVSSTAHIRLCEQILGVSLKSEYWKMFSIVIQLGAILSVLVYFWGRIGEFLRTFPKGESGRRNILTHPLSLVLIAFIITAGPSYVLDKKIGENLENLRVIGLALLIGGVVMWMVDAAFRRPATRRIEDMNPLQAIWIGAAQILSAAFPGTSRSMATIAAGQTAGMSRSAALEFSFFLSIPTMFAATGYKLLQAVMHRGQFLHDPGAPANPWLVLLVGFVVSFFVAWAVVAWFMHWVRKHGFVPFALYRIVLGAGVLVYVWRHGVR